MKTVGWVLTNVAALAIGGLIGAGTALLVAPQSGRATRAMLRTQGVMLREKAAEEAIVARSRVKAELNSLTSEAHIRAIELGDRLKEAVEHEPTVKKVVGAIPLRTNGR